MMKTKIQIDIDTFEDHPDFRDLYDDILDKLSNVGKVESFEIRYNDGDIVVIESKLKKNEL